MCCQTYKFSERVQLDSLQINELGNPGEFEIVTGHVHTARAAHSPLSSLLLLFLLLLSLPPVSSPSLILPAADDLSHTGVKVLDGNTADNAGELSNWKESSDLSSLKMLNILYDTMPSSLVSMVITEVGMIPPSSVPVVIREQTEIS